MSREIGWPERHSFGPAELRRIADILEMLQRQQPLVGMEWDADVVAPQQVWDIYDKGGDGTILPSDNLGAVTWVGWEADGDMSGEFQQSTLADRLRLQAEACSTWNNRRIPPTGIERLVGLLHEAADVIASYEAGPRTKVKNWEFIKALRARPDAASIECQDALSSVWYPLSYDRWDDCAIEVRWRYLAGVAPI